MEHKCMYCRYAWNHETLKDNPFSSDPHEVVMCELHLDGDPLLSNTYDDYGICYDFFIDGEKDPCSDYEFKTTNIHPYRELLKDFHPGDYLHVSKKPKFVQLIFDFSDS